MPEVLQKGAKTIMVISKESFYFAIWRQKIKSIQFNGTTRFKKSKQLFEYQHLLLLGDIW
jgi:hypothetical protein